MNKNTTLVLGLMALLGAALAWLLFAPPGGGNEVLGQDQEEVVTDGGRGDASLVDPGTKDPSEGGGRVEIIVPPPPKVDPSRLRPAADQTTLTGRVVDLDHAPLRGATVELWGSVNALQPGDLGFDLTAPHAARPTLEHPLVTVHRTAETDATGRFTLEALPAQATFLHIEARHGNLAPLRAFSLEPRPGRVRDLGELVMVPPGSITGVVLSQDGLPVRGADVLIGGESFTERNNGAPLQVVGLTDGMGRFVLDGLLPGTYGIGAVGRGYAMGYANFVTLESDNMLVDDVEIELQSGFPLLGVVIDAETRAAISGADVSLRPNGPGTPQSFVATTDEYGRFEYPGVNDGAFVRMLVEAPGYMRLSTYTNASGEQAGRDQITIELRKHHALTVRVLDAASEEPIPGARVNASDNNPQSLVQATLAGFARASGVEPLATTDAAGEAVVPLDREESYLTISAEGYAPVTETRPPRNNGNMRNYAELKDEELVVRLKRGATIAVAVTSSGAAVAGAEVELRIANTNPEVDAENGVELLNFRRNNRDGNRFSVASLAWRAESGLVPVARTVTGADGTALFTGINTGAYYLEVRGPKDADLGTASHGPLAVTAETERVDCDVALEAAGAVEGVVLFRGAPAAGQRVLLIAAANGEPVEAGNELPKRALVLEAVADADGRFAIAEVGAGTWKAVALLPYSIAEHRSPTSSTSAYSHQLVQNAQLVQVGPGQTVNVTLEGQSHGTTLSGVVRVNHETIRNAQINGHWTSPDGVRQDFRVRSDANGYFETTGLLPGEWTISATLRSTTEDDERQVNRRWMPFYRGTAYVPDTGDLVHNIDNETGSLELTIELVEPEEKPKDEAGNELPLAQVYWCRVRLRPDPNSGGVSQLNDRDVIDTWANHQRVQLLEYLPGGTYELSINSNGFDEVKSTIKILPGTEVKAKIQATLKAADQAMNGWIFD